MSQRQEFEERVKRMADRNGLQMNIAQNGAISLYMAAFTQIRLVLSPAARPCRVTIQYADGTIQTEPWMVLEAACRNMAAGKRQ